MSEIIYLLAIGLALGAAITGAIRYVSLRVGTEIGSPFNAVLIVMCVNVVVLLPVTAVYYYPNYGITSSSLVWFVGAGLVGTVLGRICMYTSISRIGASRTSPIVASWALISSLLGVVFLNESLTILRKVGVILVVIGVGLIARETNREESRDLSRYRAIIGLGIPIGAAVAFGSEPIFANFGFKEGTPAPVGLVVKIVAGTLGFALYLRWEDSLPSPRIVRETNTRWFLVAGLASSLSLLLYYVALSLAPVSIVVPILASNTLFVVVISRVFMPERLERVTWQLGIGATVVVSGVIMITISG